MNTVTKLLLLAGLTAIAIVGVILCLVGRKNELEKQKTAHVRKSKKTASAPASAKKYTVWAAVSGAFALLFGIWCGYIFLSYALPDSEYVKTDIVIAENGYQDERFTAGGVVYEALPLTVDDVVCSQKATAVFTYKTKGILNGYLTGNYYRIETDSGFDLIWNGIDRLFAPAKDKEAVLAYYYGEAIDWVTYDYDSAEWDEDAIGTPVSAEVAAAMQAYLLLDVKSLPTEKLILEEYVTVTLGGKSSDGIVLHDHWFIVADGKAYWELDRNKTEDQRTELTLAVLPDEIAAPLLSLAEGMSQ
ncbi:MAG: hypothetical protein J6R82_07540 [Clostridia bacterium]|nr:hypothetical protein [Clostridia bacterium]